MEIHTLLKRMESQLLESNAPIAFERAENGRFEIKGKKINGSVYTNIIVCPLSEILTEDKLNKRKHKVIQAVILMSDGQMLETSVSQDEASLSGFKGLLFNIPKYGCVSDAECSAIHTLFTSTASCGLESEIIYNLPGLTFDNNLFIFNDTQIAIQSEQQALTEQEKADSLEAFNMLIGCCTEEKSLLLLELLMVSTVFEVIKQMSVTDRRNCLPTFVPYLYGESGVGKTTIIKAFFAEMDECNRFVSLANATASGILKRISSICSGMVIVDDVPHTSANKCSKNAMESLEAVIRTYGDVGAEKVTAVSNPAEVRAWTIITAENVFLRIKSSILRTLPIEIEKGDVNFESIEVLKLNKDKFDTLMRSYLKWFFGMAKYAEEVWQINDLSELYKRCRKEMQIQYSSMESRIYDSHCQMMMYFRFFSKFFLEIGVPPDKIAAFEAALQKLLLDIATQQTLYCQENTLPYYIKVYLAELLESEEIGELTPSGTTGYSICGDNEKIQAYKYSDYLFFTAKQKNLFFSNVIKAASHLGTHQKKDVKNALLKMGAVFDPKSREPTSKWIGGNLDRIKINQKDVHVLCIKLSNFEEENSNE